MVKASAIAIGAGAAVAVGLVAYWLLRPTEEELAAAEAPAPAPAKAAAPAASTKSSAASSASAEEPAHRSAAPSAKAADKAPAVAAAAASTGGDGTVDKETLKSILNEMCEKLTSMKEGLMEKLPEFHHQAQGDYQVALQLYQAEVAASLSAIEQEVQQRYSVSQRDLMRAQQVHGGDGEVKELMTNLKRLFFGDEADEVAPDPDSIEVPEGMDADTFYGKFCRHVDIVDAAFREALVDAKANAPREGRMQYLQMLMMRRLEEVNAQAVAEIGLSEDEFQRCLMKYQGTDERFMEAVLASQQKQEALRAALLED